MSLAVKKYSTALFETVKEEDCLDEVYEQFRQVYIELKENADFNKILHTEILTVEEKNGIFEAALRDGNPYLLNFFRLLTERERTNELEEMFIEFEELYKTEKNILEVTAVTAIELNDDDKQRVREMLEKKYDKTIYITYQVDQSILGGMVLYVGETVLDASLKSKFNGLKNNMKQVRLT